MDSDTLAVTLATVAVAASVYEWTAVRWRRWPTISEVIEAGGWTARLGTILVSVLAIVDHLATHVLL
ncbi:MAG: hypothetical protein GWN02_14585 [Gemmatimonadetes bacterium]|nr:hypothetical protein [Gemmatimonadota bacterium]NIR37546.1 hypothetical protein [Actinomycetota bacterium]NIS32057.1 hypothetical protein [Actinomycetota bacterium]NIU67129.1 hypothetical protein [Actinomycetota bacterium]NIW28908.1 hypothetical protein [Actinomycetota bacterium]